MPKGPLPHWSRLLSSNQLVLAGFLLLSALLTGLPENLQQSLKFYTDQRLNNYYWGSITGYLLHNSWPHFAMNALALLLWASMYGRAKPALYWLGLSVFIMLFIDMGLLIKADFSWYVGFSGVLHGLLVHSTLLADGLKNPFNRILLIALLLKVVLESAGLLADFSSTLTGIDTAYETHLYGLLAGLLGNLLVFTYHGIRRL